MPVTGSRTPRYTFTAVSGLTPATRCTAISPLPKRTSSPSAARPPSSAGSARRWLRRDLSRVSGLRGQGRQADDRLGDQLTLGCQPVRLRIRNADPHLDVGGLPRFAELPPILQIRDQAGNRDPAVGMLGAQPLSHREVGVALRP